MKPAASTTAMKTPAISPMPFGGASSAVTEKYKAGTSADHVS